MESALWDAKHGWLYLKIKGSHWKWVKVILMLFRNDLLTDCKANQRGWPTHSLITMLLSPLSHSPAGTSRPELSEWAIIMACNHTPPSPAPSLPAFSVRFPLQCEAIRDSVCWCGWFVSVIQWATHDSIKLESWPRPICLTPEANTTTVVVQAEEMKGWTDFYYCTYMCVYMCVCVWWQNERAHASFAFLWRLRVFKAEHARGGRATEVLIPGLLKAQPGPLSSSTWENTCHGH